MAFDLNNKIYLFLIIVILFCSYPLELFSSNKKNIAVFDFTSNNIKKSYGKVVRNRIELVFYNTSKFNMLERNLIQLRFKEKLGDGVNCNKVSCAVNIGKSISADYVVFGSIDVVEKYIITVRIVDVKQGKIVIADSEECDSLDQIFNISELLGTRTVNSLHNFILEKKKKWERYIENYNQIDPFHLHLSFVAGISLPQGEFKTIAKTGLNFSGSVGWENSVYNYILALETGVFFFSAKNSAIFYSIIPIMVNFQYLLGVRGVATLSPSLSFGGTYNARHDYGDTTGAFEPIVKIGANLNFSLGSVASIIGGVNFYKIFEKKGEIEILSFLFGVKLCI